jgi:two-component system nitrogen regulation sensor histidine kinase NtrY
MTGDLQKSQNKLEQANVNLEQRRINIWRTILRNVSAGIISVNKDGIITTVNRAAEEMFDIKAKKSFSRIIETY